MIGLLSTTDTDTSDDHTYSLSDTLNFRVSNDSLFTNRIFDFETKFSYSITITSTDNQDSSYSKSFIITIIDVNEIPNNILLSDTSIAENQPINTLIGLLSTTDTDTSDDHTYSLSDTLNFRVSNDSLFTNRIFDFETKFSYSITITSTDNRDSSYSKSFIITIIDVNEIPDNILLSDTSIAEKPTY